MRLAHPVTAVITGFIITSVFSMGRCAGEKSAMQKMQSLTPPPPPKKVAVASYVHDSNEMQILWVDKKRSPPALWDCTYRPKQDVNFFVGLVTEDEQWCYEKPPTVKIREEEVHVK